MNLKKPMPCVALVLGVVVLFSSCLSSPNSVVEHTYEREDGIVYSTVDGIDLKLDIAWPTSIRGPFPVIFFINHGFVWGFLEGSPAGSGYVGDRKDAKSTAKAVTQQGYIYVSADYRYLMRGSDKIYNNLFPAAIQDVKCAVRWIRANAEKYRIDPNRIGVVGASTGGHLALLLGVADVSDGLDGDREYMDYSSEVQAVISMSGPTDLLGIYEDSIPLRQPVTHYLGGTPQEVPAAYKTASPITYLDRDDAPILSFAGTDDSRVPAQQIIQLDAKARAVGASHTAAFFQGEHSNPMLNVWNKALYSFLDAHLK